MLRGIYGMLTVSYQDAGSESTWSLVMWHRQGPKVWSLGSPLGKQLIVGQTKAEYWGWEQEKKNQELREIPRGCCWRYLEQNVKTKVRSNHISKTNQRVKKKVNTNTVNIRGWCKRTKKHELANIMTGYLGVEQVACMEEAQSIMDCWYRFVVSADQKDPADGVEEPRAEISKREACTGWGSAYHFLQLATQCYSCSRRPTADWCTAWWDAHAAGVFQTILLQLSESLHLTKRKDSLDFRGGLSIMGTRGHPLSLPLPSLSMYPSPFRTLCVFWHND